MAASDFFGVAGFGADVCAAAEQRNARNRAATKTRREVMISLRKIAVEDYTNAVRRKAGALVSGYACVRDERRASHIRARSRSQHAQTGWWYARCGIGLPNRLSRRAGCGRSQRAGGR